MLTISLAVKMSVITPELGQQLVSQRLIEEILPIEIIAHIFILCLPKYPLRHPQPDLAQAPLLLCHVCSMWRTISLNTPQLWNNFHHRLPLPRVLPSDSFLKSIRPSSLDFMEWWSKNVRGHSLSLRLALKWTQNKYVWGKNDPIRTIAFFVSMFKSAQFLEIEQSYALIVEEQLQPSPSQYPNLESVFILEDPTDKEDYHYSPRGISPWEVSPWDFSFLRTPSLKKLAIKKHYFSPDPLTVGQVFFSPHQLTHLFVNLSLSLSKWASFISGWTNLEYARIHLKIIQRGRPAAESTTRLPVPRLRQLVLDCSSPQLIHTLDNLSFPSLHSLHLLTDVSSSYTSSLPYLTVSGLAHLLDATPSLRVLHISTMFPRISHSVGYFTFPTSIPDHQRLRNCAPSLEFLVLEIFKLDTLPTEYIFKMKASGWLDRDRSTPEKLRVVLVVDKPSFKTKLLDGLKRGEWAIDGVDISVELNRDFCVLSNS